METMTLEQTYLFSQTFAGIAVVVSIIYLALQVRHNTKAVRLNTAHDVAEEFANLYVLIARDVAVADVWRKGLDNIETVQGAERTQFYSLLHSFFG